MVALRKFNMAPEKLPGPNRKGSSSNHHGFQGRTVKLWGGLNLHVFPYKASLFSFTSHLSKVNFPMPMSSLHPWDGSIPWCLGMGKTDHRPIIMGSHVSLSFKGYDLQFWDVLGLRFGMFHGFWRSKKHFHTIPSLKLTTHPWNGYHLKRSQVSSNHPFSSRGEFFVLGRFQKWIFQDLANWWKWRTR